MKIKRFNESDQIDISSERIKEILTQLQDFAAQLMDNNKMIESLTNELSNYESSATKGNDQIDDSISSAQMLKTSIVDSIDKVDNIIKNLNDYNEKGRKYLYTEK